MNHPNPQLAGVFQYTPRPWTDEEFLAPLKENKGDVGDYFRQLANEDLGDIYFNWRRKLLVELAESEVYRNDDVAGLLEMTRAKKKMMEDELEYFRKWLPKYFLIKPHEMEIGFLGEVVEGLEKFVEIKN